MKSFMNDTVENQHKLVSLYLITDCSNATLSCDKTLQIYQSFYRNNGTIFSEQLLNGEPCFRCSNEDGTDVSPSVGLPFEEILTRAVNCRNNSLLNKAKEPIDQLKDLENSNYPLTNKRNKFKPISNRFKKEFTARTQIPISTSTFNSSFDTNFVKKQKNLTSEQYNKEMLFLSLYHNLTDVQRKEIGYSANELISHCTFMGVDCFTKR